MGGSGVFHCGVEVHGVEWSYSNTSTGDGDGVFCCLPCSCKGFSYCESVPLGRSSVTKEDFRFLLQALKRQWTVDAYDLLANNCIHFCEDLCDKLGVEGIPVWVKHAAGVADAIVNAGDQFCTFTVCGPEGVDQN